MPSLEDQFGDIVAKARRGKNISPSELVRKTGLTESELADIFNCKLVPEDPTTAKLAKILGLQPERLLDSAHARWSPKPVDRSRWGCLAVLSSPYGDYVVNAYVIWDKPSKRAVLFDTGADFTSIEKVVIGNSLKIELVCLTHTHSDHVVVLDEVRKKYRPKIVTSPREPVDGAETVREGKILPLGSLTIETRETDGHSVGGLTFVVTGISNAPPIAVVGDAIFSGSMGGPMISYENLTRNIRQKILTLPDDTLLCPGHGPLTTVGEEKAHNPFFP